MNRHGYKVLLQSWFGTESGLMIGSEGKIHGWGLESFETTSYPQTGPGHFCWFSQQNFQDRALAQQLSSSEVSIAIAGVTYSRAEGRRRTREGTSSRLCEQTQRLWWRDLSLEGWEEELRRGRVSLALR